MQEKLGKGAFATVYKGLFHPLPLSLSYFFKPNSLCFSPLSLSGVHKESGFVLAIKEISDIDDDEELKKEIDILKTCRWVCACVCVCVRMFVRAVFLMVNVPARHANIVCYYGTCNTSSSLWILMDYCGMVHLLDEVTWQFQTFLHRGPCVT